MNDSFKLYLTLTKEEHIKVKIRGKIKRLANDMIHRSKLIQKHCLFKKILFIEHDLQTFLSSGKGNALLWPASGMGLIELAAGWKNTCSIFLDRLGKRSPNVWHQFPSFFWKVVENDHFS